jgi:cbb3-type cytochrome oxidase subunit 1
MTSADAQQEHPSLLESTVVGDGVARLHIWIALVFLALSTVLASLAAIQLVLPDLFTGVGFFSYGRLLPIATNLFFYGWLTIGLLGAVYFILPRVSGVDLVFGPLAGASGGLLALAYFAGSLAVGLGASEGRQYLELPLWADALAVLGLLGAVRAVTATIADRRGDELSPVEWYFGSAPIWLVLTTVVGNIPGMIGVNSIIQTAFHRGALFGLWFAAAGVGVVYYLVPTLIGRSPQRPSRLAAMGFWSLGFVWALTGAAPLTYSVVPDWFESMTVLFSIVLFLPVFVIFTDVLSSVRGAWDRVADRRALHLAMAGSVLFALIPVVKLVLVLRSSALVVGLTEWGTALEWITAYGAFTLWLLAFIVHAAPVLGSGAIGDRSAAVHYRATLLGLLLALGSMLGAGVQAGLMWIANANAGVASAGTDFRSSVERLEGWYWIRFFGIAVFALAQLWFLIAYLRGGGGAPPAEPVDDEGDGDYEPVGLARLRLGTIGLFGVAVVFGFLFPSLESSHITNTLAADESRYFDAEANPALAEISLGHELYLSEGCWYCHSQEVRQIVTDVGLGPVSLPGDYAWEVPAPRGTNRIGPDLFHVGSREQTGSAQSVLDHLFDPRSVRPWSTMPSYQHLSDGELEALALYLVNLK